MTIDFRADKPAEEAKPTSDASNPPSDTPSPADQQAFLEYNGRKLSVQDVLTKLQHADQFIETLKSEREQDRKTLAELQEKVNKAVGVQEVLEAVNQNQNQNTQAPQVPQTPVDESAIVERAAALLQERVAKASAEAKRQDNWKLATTELSKQYGDKVNEAVAEAAAKHGMSVEQAAELAKTSPSAFLALFPKSKPEVTIPGRRVNTQAVNQPADDLQVSEFFKSTSIKDRVSILQAAVAKRSAAA
jgi:hypothetical protein